MLIAHVSRLFKNLKYNHELYLECEYEHKGGKKILDVWKHELVNRWAVFVSEGASLFSLHGRVYVLLDEVQTFFQSGKKKKG